MEHKSCATLVCKFHKTWKNDLFGLEIRILQPYLDNDTWADKGT